jgi:hypothetical protein
MAANRLIALYSTFKLTLGVVAISVGLGSLQLGTCITPFGRPEGIASRTTGRESQDKHVTCLLGRFGSETWNTQTSLQAHICLEPALGKDFFHLSSVSVT